MILITGLACAWHQLRPCKARSAVRDAVNLFHSKGIFNPFPSNSWSLPPSLRLSFLSLLSISPPPPFFARVFLITFSFPAWDLFSLSHSLLTPTLHSPSPSRHHFFLLYSLLLDFFRAWSTHCNYHIEAPFLLSHLLSLPFSFTRLL
jgi:hypothetical protein